VTLDAHGSGAVGGAGGSGMTDAISLHVPCGDVAHDNDHEEGEDARAPLPATAAADAAAGTTRRDNSTVAGERLGCCLLGFLGSQYGYQTVLSGTASASGPE
jgi:hypothetical protein